MTVRFSPRGHMRVRIKRFDKDLPLPEYKTAGAVAFDLYSRISATILPGGIARLPLNIALKLPKDYMLLMAARSSLHKRGLMLANGVAIGDRDFCGNEDEYHAAVYNFSKNPVSIERGERIAQGILKRYDKAEWIETNDLGEKNRRGFGTTGRK